MIWHTQMVENPMSERLFSCVRCLCIAPRQVDLTRHLRVLLPKAF